MTMAMPSPSQPSQHLPCILLCPFAHFVPLNPSHFGETATAAHPITSLDRSAAAAAAADYPPHFIFYVRVSPSTSLSSYRPLLFSFSTPGLCSPPHRRPSLRLPPRPAHSPPSSSSSPLPTPTSTILPTLTLTPPTSHTSPWSQATLFTIHGPSSPLALSNPISSRSAHLPLPPRAHSLAHSPFSHSSSFYSPSSSSPPVSATSSGSGAPSKPSNSSPLPSHSPMPSHSHAAGSSGPLPAIDASCTSPFSSWRRRR